MVDLNPPPVPARALGYAVKRSAYSLGNAMQTASMNAEGMQAHDVRLPFTTTRWRLHLRNWRPQPGVAVAGAISFTGAFLGTHAMSASGRGAGNNTATPVQALPSFTTPSDGSEYVSGWVTSSSLQFQAFTSHLLSTGWTGAPTTSARALGASAWYKGGTGTAADAAIQTRTGLGAAGYAQFDSWIEYEYAGTGPVGFALGDSLTAGYNILESVGTPFSHSWPNLYGLRTGTSMINCGVSSIKASDLTSAANGVYTRFGLGTTIKPDFAIVFLGANDALSLFALGTFQGNLLSVITNLRSFGIPRIYLATVTPLGMTPVTTLASIANIGDTSISTVATIGSGVSLGIGSDTPGSTSAAEQRTSGTATGSGPFTIPLTGGALLAPHAAGSGVMYYGERARRDYNLWLRITPFGVQGVIDFEPTVVDPTNAANLLPIVANADGVHMTMDGYRRLALAVPDRLLIPG